MKKYGVLLILLCIMFIPMIAKADSSLTREFTCDKYVSSSGIESQKCYIKYKANGTVTKVNTIKLTLEMVNVKIVEIQANNDNDWYLKEQNGNTLTFETSKTALTGEELLGVLIVETINQNDPTCTINLKDCEFTKVERNCSIFKDKYYNKNGEITDAKTYQKECEPHYCVIWEDGTYFGKDGNVTTKETYEKECTNAYKCLKKDGKFYNKQGKETTPLQYQKECLINKCVKLSDGTYYGINGNIVDETTYNTECSSNEEKHYCKIIDNKYYGKSGVLVDKLTYQKECEKNYCTVIGDTYYDNEGNITTKSDYAKKCGNTNKFYCTEKDNQYYGISGNVVSKEVYLKECSKKSCEIKDGIYYDKDGNATTKSDYAKSCLNEITKCTEYADGTYSDSKGNIVSKEEYYKSCGVVDNPKTGSFISFLIIIIGGILAYAISYYVSKHGKIYKIN